MLNVTEIRKDFPCLNVKTHNKPLVYLDNAATSQKPYGVIDELCDFYKNSCANVNRGLYALAATATSKYSEARKNVARFIGAKHSSEIIFTKSATESINLVASSLGSFHFQAGDEIILTQMEHHANIVPWFTLAKAKNLKIHVVEVKKDGTLNFADFKRLLAEPRVKLLTFVHASHAIGTINPVREMVMMAKKFNIPTLVDGSQAVAHIPVNVSELGVDFYAFSGHKVYGPCGIGVLYGKKTWLEKMPPYQTGGDMIASVSFDEVKFAESPQKFEAGTPNISGALGLSLALEYISQIGFCNIQKYEQSLCQYAQDALSSLPFIEIIGTPKEKVSLISFIVKGVHPHDVSSLLDGDGVCIRAGHLCAEPLVKKFGQASLCRASFAFYNTYEEVNALITSLKKVAMVFRI